MKKIAIYTSHIGIGGAERVATNLAAYLVKQGYEVLLINELVAIKELPIPKGVNRIFLPKREAAGRVRNMFGRVRDLKRALTENEIDIVVSFIGKTNLRSIMATRGTGIKSFVSVRSAPAREYSTKIQRILAKHYFKKADGIIFQTEAARDYFPKKVREKSAVLLNPVKEDFIVPPFSGTRDNRIVTVGRFHSVKNHEMLINAFAVISKDYPELQLVIYGEGEHRSKLEKLIDELGMREKIKLPGNIENVAETLISARLFVLSSNVEGMPNALLEAMCLGVPAISTDCPCGGPASVIKNGVNGILIPVGGECELAEAMRRVLGDEALAQQLSKEEMKLQKQLKPDVIYGKWIEYIIND